MIGIQTKITRNGFRELSKQGRQAAARRNKELAEEVAVIARQLVPVLSGDLKSTIKAVPNKQTGSASLVAGGVSERGTIVNYAGVIEFGSADGYTPAQPFITPAIESVKARSRNRRFTMYRG